MTVSGILDRPIKSGDDIEQLFDILNQKQMACVLRLA
jgi:hypothetical protein